MKTIIFQIVFLVSIPFGSLAHAGDSSVQTCRREQYLYCLQAEVHKFECSGKKDPTACEEKRCHRDSLDQCSPDSD